MRSQLLAKSQPNLADIGNDTDSDIYDGNSSLRSGTSTNTLNEDEPEKENKKNKSWQRANGTNRYKVLCTNVIINKTSFSEFLFYNFCFNAVFRFLRRKILNIFVLKSL